MAVQRPSQSNGASNGAPKQRSNGRSGGGLSGDRRLEQAAAREDFTDPYGRKSRGVGGITKGAYIGDQAGGSSLYRWVAQLGGEPDMTKPFLQHPWVYACVSAIGRSSSSVPVRFQRQLSGGEFETVVGTDLGNVFNIPNPLQSRRKFFRAVSSSQSLYGETFLLLLKKDSSGTMVPVDAVGGSQGMMATVEMPEEIWPVRGDLADALIDPQTKLPMAWRFTTASGYVDYPAHAVVQIADINPYSPLRGAGPMQAAFRTCAKDFIIDRYDEALLQNGGSPGGVLSVDGPLTDSDQRAIKKAWEEAHGRVESNKKTAVLPKGTKYEQIGYSPVEMDHEKLRMWDRDTILSIFGVPPVVLGLESMNYATSREQHRIFWETTVTPYLEFLADELQYKLVNRIDGPESELKLDFDISGVAALREDVDAKVDRTLKLYNDGHRTFIEAARLAGWDLDEDQLTVSDERWVPSTLIQPGVGELTEPDSVLVEDTKSVDPDKLDEVYGAWRELVNMSASELESWSNNECSRKASLDPAAVIKRNLRLLRTKKGDWTSQDIKDANRAISFISRMRGMEQGEPAVKGCPSKRDISLKNWAYDPSKANRSYEGAEGGVCCGVDRKGLSDLELTDLLEADSPWPPHLKSEEQRYEYWKLYTLEEEETIEVVRKRTGRVYRDMLLWTRRRLREIAASGDWSERRAAKQDVGGQVWTKAEIERLLGIDKYQWGLELSNEIVPPLSEMMATSGISLAGEIEAVPLLFDSADPFITAFYRDYPVYLAEGSTSTLAKAVHDSILRTISSAEIGTVGSLAEAIHLTLRDQEIGMTFLINKLPERAERIAATETAKAHNGARVEEMKRNGVKKHIWLSSRDGLVRPTHQIDGEAVNVGEPFSNGVIFPGDSASGPPQEVINCRCTTVASREDISSGGGE